MAEKETVAGAGTNQAAEVAELSPHPGQTEQPAPVEAQPVGPEGAAPHWREFYQAIRDAVEAMRSS